MRPASHPNICGPFPWLVGICRTCGQRTEVDVRIPSPAAAYVLDVCECGGDLRLFELNPFGTADLYVCDPFVVVDRGAALAIKIRQAKQDPVIAYPKIISRPH